MDRFLVKKHLVSPHFSCLENKGRDAQVGDLRRLLEESLGLRRDSDLQAVFLRHRHGITLAVRTAHVKSPPAFPGSAVEAVHLAVEGEMTHRYPIEVFYSEEDQAWVADVPDLAYCSATGETAEEAVREAQAAAEAWLASAAAHGDPLPTPRRRVLAS